MLQYETLMIVFDLFQRSKGRLVDLLQFVTNVAICNAVY
jgi:hypothetical protein